MSTNSNIYKVMADGSVQGIYCHWDGYYAHNGVILYESYRDPQKVEQLLSLGNVSYLSAEIEPSELTRKYGFDYYGSEDYLNLPEMEQKRLQHESQQHTLAYHRDRGEDLRHAKTYSSLATFKEAVGDLQEFVYLLAPKDGKNAQSHDFKDWEWVASQEVVLPKDNYTKSNYLRGVNCTYVAHTNFQPLGKILERDQ